MTLRSLLKIQRTPLSAVTAVTPPTRVLAVQPSGGFGDTTTPKSSPTFDVVNGDLLVLQAFSEDSTVTLGTPTWDGTGTWTLQQSVVVSSYCTAYLFTCPVTATATGRTITVTQTGGLTRMWSFIASLWRNHGGLGVTGKANVTGGLPTLTLPVGAGSAVVCGNSDWAAVDGTTRTWNTVNGAAMTEAVYFRSAANYTMYTGYSIDTAGLLGGPETLGLVTPGGQTYAILGAEIKGTVSSLVTGTLNGTLPRLAAAISGTSTNSGTLTAAAPLVTSTISEVTANTGTLAASLPRATAALTGTATNPGTLTASTIRATSTLTGTSTDTGALTASVPVVTAAITGASTNPATLSASAPLVTASIADTTVVTGTLSASLPRVTTSLAGTQANTGTFAATTPTPTAALAGASVNSGTMAASIVRPTATIAGTMTNGATMTTATVVPIAALTGSSTNTAALTVSTPRLTMQASGSVVNVGALVASTPAVTALLSGTVTNGAMLTVALPLVTFATISAYLPLVDPDHMRIVPTRNGTRTVEARDPIRTVLARGATRTVEARDGTRTITARPYVRRVP